MFRSKSRQSKALKALYEDLASERDSYVQRAIRCAKLTLPWFIQEEGVKDTKLESLYQSTGAEGVTNLASRLVMVLMPPNRPLFRLRIDREIINQLSPDQKKETIPEIEAGLSRIEQAVTAHIETLGDRTELYSAVIHLLLAGNVLLRVSADGLKVYPLQSFVVERDPDGNVLTIIIKEVLDAETLPEGMWEQLVQNDPAKNVDNQSDSNDSEDLELYTVIRRLKKRWEVYQECDGNEVGKAGHYPLDKCPWQPLRLYRSAGESYGRGYVEQYMGSLHSLEVLSKALVEAAAAASKVVFLVKPTSSTDASELAKAPNMGFIPGQKSDIDVLQIEKYNDFRVAQSQIQELKKDLAKVFLMHSSVQRDAERVTAEEIRYLAQELETALGGLYSVLGKEFQTPYINLRIDFMKKKGLIPRFDTKITPNVVTGIDALGRGQDANTLLTFGQTIFKAMPQEAAQYLNIHGYLKTLAAAYGIDDSVIIKSEEEIKQQQQQAQQQSLLQQAVPNAVKAGGDMLTQQMTNQSEEQGGQ